MLALITYLWTLRNIMKHTALLSAFVVDYYRENQSIQHNWSGQEINPSCVQIVSVARVVYLYCPSPDWAICMSLIAGMFIKIAQIDTEYWFAWLWLLLVHHLGSLTAHRFSSCLDCDKIDFGHASEKADNSLQSAGGLNCACKWLLSPWNCVFGNVVLGNCVINKLFDCYYY